MVKRIGILLCAALFSKLAAEISITSTAIAPAINITVATDVTALTLTVGTYDPLASMTLSQTGVGARTFYTSVSGATPRTSTRRRGTERPLRLQGSKTSSSSTSRSMLSR